MNSGRDIPTFKIITLGCSNVGKSSILLKYIKNEFNESMANTVGIDNINKVVKVKASPEECDSSPADAPVHLQIWDTAGQERFGSIVKSYYRGVDAFLFVYDVTDHRTLEYVESRIAEIAREKVGIRRAVIIGNKADLISSKRQRKEEVLIKGIAAKLNREALERELEDGGEPIVSCGGSIPGGSVWDYCLTSALTGQNINEMFEKLSRCLYGIDKESPKGVVIKKKRKCSRVC